MDNQVRIFRKNPIAWWDKNAMRYLRRKYGKVKKTFALIRAVYLALCEIESDFSDSPINFFTQTVGTYAGTSRQVAGKYINMLEKDGWHWFRLMAAPHEQFFWTSRQWRVMLLRRATSLSSGGDDDDIAPHTMPLLSWEDHRGPAHLHHSMWRTTDSVPLAAPEKFETKCSAYTPQIRATHWLAGEQFCLELRWCCSLSQ
jgi:hypothetical protein